MGEIIIEGRETMQTEEIETAYLLKPRPRALRRIEYMESERHSHCVDEKERKNASGKRKKEKLGAGGEGPSST
jgi:hypothetical protein